MVDFDLILDVAVTCDAVAFAAAHGTGGEAGCEGQSRAREKGARGGGGLRRGGGAEEENQDAGAQEEEQGGSDRGVRSWRRGQGRGEGLGG